MFVNGISTLNAQDISSSEETFFGEVQTYSSPILKTYFSDFKKYIKPAAMRRMSLSVKMGVIAASKVLESTDITQPDAIIVGTGMGCKTDSDVFLENLLASNEGLLSPTKFIQSTHNTVAGQIALQLKCKAYNMTFVQGAASFETALLDAFLQSNSSKNRHLLVGGVDEISKYSNELHQLDGQLKTEQEICNLNLLDYASTGSISGEGASFFVVSGEKSEASYASVKNIETYNQLGKEGLKNKALNFLKKNELNIDDIDVFICGNNGDINYDDFYHSLQTDTFSQAPQLYYKHLVGEFYTSSGFAFWLACKILRLQEIPEICQLNNFKPNSSIKTILLYNQYKGRDHSFILLQSC